MSIAYVFVALSALYGLSWLVFAIIEPPASVTHYYRSPNALYFLPERGGRLAMAVLFMAVLPMFATFIITMFTQ